MVYPPICTSEGEEQQTALKAIHIPHPGLHRARADPTRFLPPLKWTNPLHHGLTHNSCQHETSIALPPKPIPQSTGTSVQSRWKTRPNDQSGGVKKFLPGPHMRDQPQPMLIPGQESELSDLGRMRLGGAVPVVAAPAPPLASFKYGQVALFLLLSDGQSRHLPCRAIARRAREPNCLGTLDWHSRCWRCGLWVNPKKLVYFKFQRQIFRALFQKYINRQYLYLKYYALVIERYCNISSGKICFTETNSTKQV